MAAEWIHIKLTLSERRDTPLKDRQFITGSIYIETNNNFHEHARLQGIQSY